MDAEPGTQKNTAALWWWDCTLQSSHQKEDLCQKTKQKGVHVHLSCVCVFFIVKPNIVIKQYIKHTRQLSVICNIIFMGR